MNISDPIKSLSASSIESTKELFIRALSTQKGRNIVMRILSEILPTMPQNKQQDLANLICEIDEIGNEED